MANALIMAMQHIIHQVEVISGAEIISEVFLLVGYPSCIAARCVSFSSLRIYRTFP